jgi:hypothetical protein
MEFIDVLLESHRAAIRMGVQQLLSQSGWTQQRLAKAINSSEQRFNRCLRDTDDFGLSAYTTLTLDTFKALSSELLPSAFEETMFHLEQYIQATHALQDALPDFSAAQIMDQAWSYRIGSLYTQDPEASVLSLREGVQFATQAIRSLMARHAWLEAARVALVAHDWMHTLHRLGTAAYYATLAEHLLNQIQHTASERYYFINAMYALGVTRRMLKQPRSAREIFDRIKLEYPSSRWKPHAQREALMTRLDEGFDLKNWSEDWDKHRKTLDAYSSSITAWDEFTAHRIRAEAWTKKRLVKQAQREWDRLSSVIETTEGVTIVHRVTFQKKFAQAQVQFGYIDNAFGMLTQAFNQATRAGLTHQLDDIRGLLGTLHSRRRKIYCLRFQIDSNLYPQRAGNLPNENPLGNSRFRQYPKGWLGQGRESASKRRHWRCDPHQIQHNDDCLCDLGFRQSENREWSCGNSSRTCNQSQIKDEQPPMFFRLARQRLGFSWQWLL